MFRSKLMFVVSLVALLAFAFTAAVPAKAAAQAKPTIVDVALSVNASNGEFSTLIAALAAADLVGALDGKGQYTVFAPTDAAFAKLGLNAGNIGTAFDKATLTKILLYHVAPGERFASDVVSSSKIRTLSKSFLGVKVNADGAFLVDNLGREAKIVATDIDASNGVIHIIDTVVLPVAP
jgi:uncharacterized surface protein with fasciclin (FAS1) repeats